MHTSHSIDATQRYLVLGASGLVGSRVVDLLANDGLQVLGATRHPRGPGEVRLDLLDSASFGPALEAVTTVMLISRPGDEEAHRHAGPFIAAMRRSGVRRVVVLSALGAERRPQCPLRQVELLVEHSGLAWTHVRPNFFMQTLALPPLSAEVAARGTLSLPLADAAIAYVDVSDVAAVLHRALVDDSLSGRAIAVTGPEALTHKDIAQTISAAIGRPVRYVPLPEDVARDRMLARGFSPAQVARVLAFHAFIRQGFCGATDSTAARLLARPLRTWSAFVAGHRGAWRTASDE